VATSRTIKEKIFALNFTPSCSPAFLDFRRSYNPSRQQRSSKNIYTLSDSEDSDDDDSHDDDKVERPPKPSTRLHHIFLKAPSVDDSDGVDSDDDDQ